MAQVYHLPGGRFTVKDGEGERQFSLVFEAGPGPMVILKLPPMEKEEAQKIASALTPVEEVVLDFN